MYITWKESAFLKAICHLPKAMVPSTNLPGQPSKSKLKIGPGSSKMFVTLSHEQFRDKIQEAVSGVEGYLTSRYLSYCVQ